MLPFEIRLVSKREIKNVTELLISRCLWCERQGIMAWSRTYYEVFNESYFKKQVEVESLYGLFDGKTLISFLVLNEYGKDNNTIKNWQQAGFLDESGNTTDKYSFRSFEIPYDKCLYLHNFTSISDKKYRGCGKVLLNCLENIAMRAGYLSIRAEVICNDTTQSLLKYYEKNGLF